MIRDDVVSLSRIKEEKPVLFLKLRESVTLNGLDVDSFDRGDLEIWSKHNQSGNTTVYCGCDVPLLHEVFDEQNHRWQLRIIYHGLSLKEGSASYAEASLHRQDSF